MKQLYKYMKKRLKKIDRDPKIFFNENQHNADDIIGKTGFYDPKSEEIHLFITDRHAKDVLRSFAHEVVHHEQNCSGYTATVDMSKTTLPDYASHDKGLRKAEKDAFTRGNLIFRDWTDSLKAKREKGERIMAEGKKMKKKLSEVEKAKKLARQHARKHMKHSSGKDVKDLKKAIGEQEHVEKLEENKTPHPELFEKKERLMKDAFQKRDEIVYQQLLEKFGIKKDENK